MASPAERRASKEVCNMLRNANPIVVGGGPCGAFAAALLADRDIPVTLIEKQQSEIPMEIPRAYQMRVGQRGREALRLLPDLLSEIAKQAVPTTATRFAWVDHTGKGGASPPRRIPKDAGADLVMMRHTLVQTLTDFVATCKGVTSMYSTTVTSVQPLPDDSFDVVVQNADGSTATLNTRLVIACDGVNSIVAKSLSAPLGGQDSSSVPSITSSAGLDSTYFEAVNTDTCIKTIAVNHELIPVLDEIVSKANPRSEEKDVFTVCVLIGGLDRSGNRVRLMVLPQAPNKHLQEAGVSVASITAEEGHELWQLETAEDGFSFFTKLFPQFDARKYISEDHMADFVKARPTAFPAATRRNSLGAHLGNQGKAGVVFLGDAAHTHPPSGGQGVNASFQDAAAFAQMIDALEGDVSIESLLNGYEAKRDADTTALLQMIAMMKVSLGGSKMQLVSFVLDQKMKRWLARYIPGMYPSLSDLLWTDLPFSEVVRRVNVTTTRLRLGALSMLLIPAIAYAIARKR